MEKSTGRELVIEGDIRPSWSLVHPRFRMGNVSLSNAKWGKEKYLFSAESVDAYRRAIELQPTLGEAWWSLANLKSIRFGAADIEALEQALGAGKRLTDDDRLHLHFALGKAHEDAAAPEPAYRHYAAGNAIRAQQLRYDPGPVEALVAAATERLDERFFAARQGQGDPGPGDDRVLPQQ